MSLGFTVILSTMDLSYWQNTFNSTDYSRTSMKLSQEPTGSERHVCLTAVKPSEELQYMFQAGPKPKKFILYGFKTSCETGMRGRNWNEIRV